MASTSNRTINLTFTGDHVASPVVAAATNAVSPAAIAAPITLAAGDNQIIIPQGGTTPTCVTIVKPPGNTARLALKAVQGDAGFLLHKTDPDSVSIDPSMTDFVINAASQVTGVTLIWS